ncbi:MULTISPECIES: agmatine deiminase family protein [Gammaproteobacteria]|uniref:agmatine deiminase family protein n=1 Tax=Gammaproteobacteria TaxID=1236 RepID=UPI000DCFCCE6|nr:MULTISPECIES: agmatine deiminase family protein [Gammaproteobacteria]RTE87563.1 agmatine deiminase family protein [Aliidiomarina sp. B3213]TCZ92653.1 agmatine deiminase family protein [Lysobacter sp. N42]
MPASLVPEWIPSKALWLRWPERPDVWPNHGKATQQELLLLCKALRDSTEVSEIAINLMVSTASSSYVHNQLAQHNLTHVQLFEVAYADLWSRDCAPLVCSDGSLHHFNFDGWSGIDHQWQLDISARNWLSQKLQAETPSLLIAEHDFVLEGGAIHTDGQGTALVCAGSLLQREKNKHYSTQDIEALLKDALGLKKVIWLPGTMSADETGGHVDNMACFLAPGVVAVNDTDYSNELTTRQTHPDHQQCLAVERVLSERTDANGNAFELVKLPLPMPPRLTMEESCAIESSSSVRERPSQMPLMATYVNFIRLNNTIVLPAFGCSLDQTAKSIMTTHFPQFEIIQTPCRALLVGGGGWHCASWNEPDFEKLAKL